MSTNENTPISGEFWDWMQSYWHSNRDFPPAHPDWRKKADLVDGKVPAGQLPSYVDDVLEFDSYLSLPQPGEKGKIYITTKDNKQFRWGGSAYIEINSGEKVGSKIINGSYNANDLSTNSITYGYSVANAPSTVGAHSFSILNLDTTTPDYKMQLGFDGDTNEMFSRIKSNGNWSDWSKYTTSSQLGNLLTTNTDQDVTAQKWFKNISGSSNWEDHRIVLTGQNGSKAGLSFYSAGMDIGTLDFDGYYHFKYSSGSYTNVKAGGFLKNGSDDNSVLLGGGGHKSLSELMTTNTAQNVIARKEFITSGGDDSINNSLFISCYDGHLPAISFYRPGIDLGQLKYVDSNLGFYFVNSPNSDTVPANAKGFRKSGSDDNYVLLGGGGHKPVSDFVSSADFSTVHKFDQSGGINNGSGTRINKSWFDYHWAETGYAGSVINFSGLNGAYSTELFADYYYGNSIGLRTHNGDTNSWNPVRWLWHSGNFNPDNKANVSDLNKKDGAWIQSARNFPDGTLIRTNIDYSQDYGSAWMLEIKANMYATSIPMDCKIVGYIYGGTIIEGKGYSTSQSLTQITALNLNGELCFWFPTMGYWQGFTIKVTDVTGGAPHTINRAYAIENLADPGGTKRVNIYVDTIATRDWVNNNFATQTWTADNYIRKAIIFNDNFDTISGNISGIYRASNPGSGIKYLYAPMLHMGGYDTKSQLQIQYANGNDSITGELSYRGGFNNGWGSWRTAWDNVNLNPVTLDTPQTIIHQKTFNQGIGLTSGQKINLAGYGDPAHYIKRFDDDTDGFGISTGFAVKPYNDSSKNLLLVDGSGTYVNGNRVWDLGNFNPEWKAERENNAVGIGFEGGNIENPYMKHNAGAAYLATKNWITSSFIPKTHPAAGIGQSQINGWNNAISQSSASEEVILEDDTLKIQPDEFSLEGSGSYDIASRKKLVHVLVKEGKELVIRELVRRQTIVVFNFSKNPVDLNIEGLKSYALSPGMQVTLYISDKGEVLLYNETGFKKMQ